MSSMWNAKVHTLTTSLELFHEAVRDWFTASFPEPTKAQSLGWPAIAKGEWTLIFAPTGSGKTLTAFLWALDRLMFAPVPKNKAERRRVVYISPRQARAVAGAHNLHAPRSRTANVAAPPHKSFTTRPTS